MALAFVMKFVLMHALCLITPVVQFVGHFLRLRVAYASPAHLYIPQLFAHHLLTIICVTLMSIVYLIQHLYCISEILILLLYYVFEHPCASVPFTSPHLFCRCVIIHAHNFSIINYSQKKKLTTS